MLRKLGERYRKLLEVQETENVDFLEYFFGLLEQINEFYKRVFPFQEMFYDFLQNGSRREYRAALPTELMSRLQIKSMMI